MSLIVIKRDGTAVSFNKEKIETAVNKAFIDVDGITNDEVAVDIAEKIEAFCMLYDGEITVEKIQDAVEKLLIERHCIDVAKSYIKYRQLHEMARDGYNKLMNAISEKLTASNVQNQNANVDEHSFGGRVGEASDLVMKQYALDYLVKPLAKKRHLENEIYIHDLNAYAVGSHNCLSIPFDDLLAKGFNTRQTDVRPANSVNTAMQLVAVIFQLQSLQQFGGVSATHFDWTMVPYVRKSFFKHYKDGVKYLEKRELDYSFHPDLPIDEGDYQAYSSKAYEYAMDMTEKEVHQGIEALFHNLNTLQSRSGNQLPFTSLNFGTCTLPEGRMVTKALLECSIEGIGKLHRTSVFPCTIFQCMKGVNRAPGDPNYDLYQLALKSTAKRLYPNYVNCDWSGNTGYNKEDPCEYMSSMGCRTVNGFDINGLGQRKDGRGNIAPTTIIMPTLAMIAKEAASEEYDATGEADAVANFMQLLDERIHEAKDNLIDRFNWIASQSANSARFMYENGTMAGYVPEEGVYSALKHGTLAVGNLGLAETLQILIGKNHTTPEGMALAKRIYELFNKRCAEFKKKYKLNFGVYNTPAENLCYTAMKKFQEKYGKIPNVSDHEYFTNSMHVPVWEKMDALRKIDIESELTGYSNAGCITYIELESNVINNIPALEKIVNYAMEKDIPYFAINTPDDQCMDCGYNDDVIEENCPKCDSDNIKRLRRVTGYLTNDYKTAFNLGKQAETEERVKHDQIEL